MYTYKRLFTGGKIRACVFDWSGTIIDKYSIAPVKSLVDTFNEYDIKVTGEQVRLSMGVRKDNHIKQILELPSIAEQWDSKNDNPPSPDDINNISKLYKKKQIESIGNYTELIPSVHATLRTLKNKRVRIGGTTGFYSNITDVIKSDIQKQGLVMDAFVSGDDVDNGSRPNPFMLYKCLELMNIGEIRSVLKVDDTVAGIEEGLNAGAWTVGVARYSNYMGINSQKELENLTVAEYSDRVRHSMGVLRRSGAHYVIDKLSDIHGVISDIEKRLDRGEKP